jgi:hypothetical protein
MSLLAPERRIRPRLLPPGGGALVDRVELRARAPRREPQPAAGAADAGELTSDGLVVRREDRAKARGDDVEDRVLVRKVLRVAFVPLDRETVGVGVSLLQQRRRDVDADRLCARAGGTDRDRAGPGGDVEPALAGPRLERGDEPLVDRGQPLGDERVLAARPDVRSVQRRVPPQPRSKAISPRRSSVP